MINENDSEILYPYNGIDKNNILKNRNQKNDTSQEKELNYVNSRLPELSLTHRISIVLSLFITFFVIISIIYLKFPKLESTEIQHIKLPRDIEEAKNLGRVLAKYNDVYYFQVLSAIFVVYIFLQTFAIPGSISLSILSGFLFPFPIALLLICFCSATGASLCYLLSHLFGRRLVYKYWPDKASKWAQSMRRHQNNLLNYMLFLRMTPFLPNWFINLAAPVVGVPIRTFWIGTFLGVAPPSFVAVQAGQTLFQLTTSSEAWSWTSILLLIALSLLSLVPILFRSNLKEKFEGPDNTQKK